MKSLSSEREFNIETLAVHAGREIDPSTKAVCPPINLSTTFERDEDGSYPEGYIYRRNNNPNRESLELCISKLENGVDAAAFSSGSAAAMSIFQSLNPGDHIIAPEDVYHGTAHQLKTLMKRWDIDTTFVDMTDTEKVERAIENDTKLIWIETPSNPLLKITDMKDISAIAHENDAISVCDNTWSTSIIQRPFNFDVDIVLYSTTKYFGGHSDALGGAIVTKQKDDFFENIREYQIHGGSTPSPFDCWLIMRGIRTLPYRIKGHSKNAMKIARFLEDHDEVEKVHYPGLRSHPNHKIAKKQMSMFGGMLSFQVKGDRDKAFEVAANVEVFTRATSLGSVESLIEHRSSIEGEESTTPENLLRLSVGLENSDDLIDDLDNALKSSS